MDGIVCSELRRRRKIKISKMVPDRKNSDSKTTPSATDEEMHGWSHTRYVCCFSRFGVNFGEAAWLATCEGGILKISRNMRLRCDIGLLISAKLTMRFGSFEQERRGQEDGKPQ